MRNPKRPRDTNQLAKLVTDIATGEKNDDHHKVNGHHLGGIKGGKARSEKLTPEQRKEIAKKAAQKRWHK